MLDTVCGVARRVLSYAQGIRGAALLAFSRSLSASFRELNPRSQSFSPTARSNESQSLSYIHHYRKRFGGVGRREILMPDLVAHARRRKWFRPKAGYLLGSRTK